jgi:hypothetical protein
MILDFLFLPVIIFIGAITSYEDSRIGIVRNKWIKFGFFWGVGTILLLLLYSFFAKELSHFFFSTLANKPDENKIFTIFPSYLFKQLANAATALLIAFVMWKRRVWAAGDAKLFFIFALLLPLKYYQKSYFPLFPSFVLLINIFMPIFCYFMLRAGWGSLKMLIKKVKKETVAQEKPLKKNEEIKQEKLGKFNFLSSMKVVSIILLLFMTIKLIPNEFFQKYLLIDAAMFQAAILIAMIAFGSKFIKFISQKKVLVVVIVFFIVALLNSSTINNLADFCQLFFQMLFMFLIFMVIFSLFNRVLNFYIEEEGTKRIKREELVSGVFVDEEIIGQLKKDEKLANGNFEATYLEGLNQKQVDMVKTWLRKKDQKQIKTYISFPFVVWMFGGVVITFILQGSLLNFLLPWVFGR